MNTKLLAVVSTGALLLMSGPADAGGRSAFFEWLAGKIGIISERSVPDVLKYVRSVPDVLKYVRSVPDVLKYVRPVPDVLKYERPVPDVLKYERPVPDVERSGLFKAEKVLPTQLFGQPRRDIIDLKVSSLYDEATPEILDALKVPEALTQQQLEKAISDAVSKAIENATKEKGSGLTFEVLSGKLKIDSAYTTPWGKVISGEVNIYKISAVLAAGVIACKDQPGYNECAKAAFAKVGSVVAKEVVPESARIPEKSPTIQE